jgi:MIP family channel proteins
MTADTPASLRRASWRSTTWGELLAELIGTFVLICFGDGVVAMAVAALNQSGRGAEIFDASGDWLIIGWGWGFAVAFGVYVAGGISGAHINPAVTLALAARRGFPWRKVPGYIAAQVLGAFLGAVLVYVVYKGAIDSYERAHHIVRGHPDSLTTFSIFATFPAKYLGNWVGPFVDQVVGTAFLVAFIFALIDVLNQPPKANLAPLLIGFVVVAVGRHGSADHRAPGDGDWHVVRLQRRLRHQSRPRLRTASVRLDRRLGQGRDPRRLRQRRRLHVDTDRRSVRRRPDRRICLRLRDPRRPPCARRNSTARRRSARTHR